jgi:hypothetical protein
VEYQSQNYGSFLANSLHIHTSIHAHACSLPFLLSVIIGAVKAEILPKDVFSTHYKISQLNDPHLQKFNEKFKLFLRDSDNYILT